MPLSRTTSRPSEHVITTELDHQRGGWVWSCSCGEGSRRSHWYKRDAKLEARDHVEEVAASA